MNLMLKSDLRHLGRRISLSRDGARERDSGVIYRSRGVLRIVNSRNVNFSAPSPNVWIAVIGVGGSLLRFLLSLPYTISLLYFVHHLQSTMSAAPSNPSFSMSAYMVPSTQPNGVESEDDVASLPSESTTDSDLETLSDEYSDAEAEWRESIEQLELLLTMVLVPFIGKYLGRKCAHWSELQSAAISEK